MNKDYDKIAKIEKVIAKKYGNAAIQNPKANWTEEKEKVYLESVKKFYKKCEKNREEINKLKALRSDELQLSPCPICSRIILSEFDEVAILKYECCYSCYIDFVEGRENRWKEGWRPDKESVFKKN